MTVWPNGSREIPRVSDEFGPRVAPTAGASTFHRGIDLVGFAINKSPVNGTVIFARYNGGAGNMITIREDGTGDEFIEMHNARFLVSEGQHVSEGQDIGVQGTTGASTGIHCHFETHPGGGAAINPRDYMAGAITAGGGSSPINNQSKEDGMTATIKLTTDSGAQHYFNVGEEFIKHCGSEAQALIASKVNSGSDEIHNLNQTQFTDYLDAMGVPRAVVDIEGGMVQDLSLDPVRGAKNASWSRRREAVQKLDLLLKRVK